MIKFLKLDKKRGAKNYGKRRGLKFLLPIFSALALVSLSGYFLILVPVRGVLASAKKLPAHSKPLKDALLLQDLPAARAELESVSADVAEIQQKLNRLSWLRFVPFARSYFLDAQHLVSAADHGAAAGKEALDALVPVAGVLGLKTDEGEATPMSPEDQVAAILKAAPQLSQALDRVTPDLLAAKADLTAINPRRYPQVLKVNGYSVQEALTEARSYAQEMDKLLPKVKETLTVLPGIMGEPRARTYVVIFQNDKEIRPTGGFWTAYALVKIASGKVIDISSEDMYFVDYRIPRKTPAPAVYQRFLKIDHWFIRDANLSPDYAVSAQKFLSFWKQAGSPPVDGVLALDTYMVRDLLDLLGEVKVSGYPAPFTSKNVVLELEKQATLVKKEQAGRKALVGQLMDKMLEKVFQLPKTKYDDLIVAVIRLANEKHLLFYFPETKYQTWAENLNWAGRVRESDGDYLFVDEANFAGAKANLYVKRQVTQRISRDANGRWVKEVIVDFENPEPYDGWLNGPYRCYVRLLVPRGSELLSIEGSQEAVPRQSFLDEAVGKQVFAAFNVTKPLGKSRLTFKYRLPEGLITGNTYPLLVQKQPGLDHPQYRISLGKKSLEFELTGDRKLEINTK